MLFGSLLALLATGCQPASAPDAPATTASGTGPDLMENSPGMMAEHDHMAGMAATPAAAAGQGPYAQAMRLHDAAMNRMDALAAERQRLAGALAQLGTAKPANPGRAARLRRTVAALEAADGQMMDWMHNAHAPDSTSHSGAQVAAYWQQQLPVLRKIDQRTTAALDSARALR
ncbi:hypothetical protein EAH73_02600 [Hymenobacter nivis]|uniref:DUF4142 domain-containing protein n=1 Tax=Hymenobacter nivis TaxID=1850093 RepID=A0A502HG55_9BACT|nr:hypothetical protein EAH73_02600 [Hymenobacter nivis]